MRKRQTRMQDGRYMIFYTFEDEPSQRAEKQRGGNVAEEKPQVKLEATEGRSV